ncbi:MAG: carboxypeptidase-like regulatory domain-containing protein [Gemmatimonadota bacterium]|nr:carboxypeptidase-like regulatory domain-containing protein [Gemmatimonadota bacterium]
MTRRAETFLSVRFKPAGLLLLIGLLSNFPDAAFAQAGFTLLGRAYEASSDLGVQNGIATLEGYGSTLTNTEGRFRFRNVAPGEYTLRVEAFGYAPVSLSLAVEADAAVDVPLAPAPVPLDPIVVEAGTLDYQGRVRDPARDFYLVDAQVIARGRDPLWTDTQGRFDLKDVPEGVPLNLTIRAFGYLPIDTTFVPDDETRYDFELRRDAFSEAMIEMQLRRIDEQGRGRLTVGRGVMDRQRIVRYAGSATVSSMLEFEYPERTLERIVCTFIDDRPVDGGFGALAPEMARVILEHLLPEEIERLEMLQFDSAAGRPLMLQIYTRSFIMAMATQNVSLRTPAITPFGRCI